METQLDKVHFQKYPVYKNSETEWIGEIPKHWSIKRLKYLFSINKRISGELGYDVLSITLNGIKVKDIESGEGQLSMDYSKYQLVYKGDFAMNHMDLLTGYVDISPYDGVISPDYRVFKLTDYNCNDRYLLLLFQLGYKSRIFYAYGQGVSQLGRWRFPAENFNNFLMPIPPLSEQIAIATFLNRKTAQIEKAIIIKEKQIELLTERRQILIHKAVTRGLNPNVKMKDSGVERIGEIPEHWGIMRLKNICEMLVSNVDKHSKPNEQPVKLCNYVDVYKNDFITSAIEFMEASASPDEISRFKIQINDVIITKDSEDWLDIGVPAIVKYEETNLICGYHLAILRPNKGVHGGFLHRTLLSPYIRTQFSIKANGVTRYGISHGAILGVSVIFPPLKEQKEISIFIESGLDKITTAMTCKVREIEKLKEYRATLINSAVTGKIKVS